MIKEPKLYPKTNGNARLAEELIKTMSVLVVAVKVSRNRNMELQNEKMHFNRCVDCYDNYSFCL